MIFRFGKITIAIGEASLTEADRQRSCEQKQAYKSEATAVKSAQAMQEKGHGALEAYKCRHCPFWHIGHGETKN